MAERKSDEAILIALCNAGSVKAASRECGVSPPTIYRRLQDDAFRQKLDAVRDDALKEASARLSGRLTAAVDALTEIMNDRNTAQQTRANAAAQILSYGLRFAETCDFLRRTEALEKMEGISDADAKSY